METMTAKTGEDALYVQTFGGFSLTYKGKVITGNVKSRESQFIYLMQLVLHERVNGVSRERLEEALFADRDIEDIRHAMRSVIYNAKKKLQKAGLPDVNYIVQKDGVYCWTKEVPVVEDAREFERLYQEAESETDPDSRLGLFIDACYHYTGEFLPAHAGILWAAREARRYRALFCSCVEKTVSLLRNGQNFLQMEELGVYAAKISPLSDWETVTMEALVSLGRYEDARRLYDDTVELYFQEQGLRISGRMKELFHKLGAQMEHRYKALDDIQTSLSEEREDKPGGYLCSYPVFQGIYRMVERMMGRGGQSVYLMLCIVVDARGRAIKDEKALEDLTGRLGDAVLNSVRRSDAVSRYGRGQYLVLLVNTTFEDCHIIQERINRHFRAGHQRTGIQYYVNGVICSPDRGSVILDKGK